MASSLRTPSKSRRATRPQNGRPALKRAASGSFLSNLKNLVVTPFTWLNGGGDKEAIDEEMEEEEGNVGSKRRGDTKIDASPARKRVKKSPSSTFLPAQNAPSAGYLDPPVLRDSTSVSNAGARPRTDFTASSFGTTGPVSIPTESRRDWVFTSVAGQQPPQNASAPQPPVTKAPENQSLQIQAPLGPSSQSVLHSQAVGARRTPLFPSAANTQPLRRQPSSIHHDYSQLPRPLPQFGHGDQTGKNGIFGASSRSPSAGDSRMQLSPIRKGSIVRRSGTPQRITALPGTRTSAGPNAGALYRRSSSVMMLDSNHPSNLVRRPSSQVVFDEKLGMTTTEEIVARQPQAPIPRNNAERILLALEKATPLSDARRIRLQQKAAIKVPMPSVGGPLSGRAGRMVAPYARPSGDKSKSKIKEIRSDALPLDDEPRSKPAGALRRYLETQRKAREEKIAAQHAEDSTKPGGKQEKGKQRAKDEDQTMQEQDDMEDVSVPEPKPKASRKEPTKGEASLPRMEQSSSMPGRSTSSLRAGRTPTHRTHMPATKPTNKFSARFDDEDDDDDDDEGAGLTSKELKAWTERGGGTLAIPAGFKFDSVEVPKAKTFEPSENYKSAVEREADIRAELYKKLRGDTTTASAFYVPPSVKPSAMPQVPNQPFAFGGFTPSPQSQGQASSTSGQSSSGQSRPEPRLSPVAELPKSASDIAKVPVPVSFNFSSSTGPDTALKNPDFAPAKATEPVKSLPFSFGLAAPAIPKPSQPAFSFTPAAPQTSQTSTAAKPLFGGFGASGPASAAPTPTLAFGGATTTQTPAPEAAPSSTLTSASTPKVNFGSPFSLGAPPSSSTAVVPVPSSTPVESARSSAPSPSPAPSVFSGLGLGPPPASSQTTTVSPSPFSFGQPATATTALPANTPVSTPAIPELAQPAAPFKTVALPETQSPALFGGSAPSSTQVSKPPMLFGNSNTTSAPASGAPQPLFGSSVNAAGPSGAAGGAGFKFSFGSAASGEATKPSPFAGAASTIIAPSSDAGKTSNVGFFGQTASNPPASSPFAFGSAASNPAGASNKAAFTFGSGGFGSSAASTPSGGLLFSANTRPKTPPAQDGDMMDEGSPTRSIVPSKNNTASVSNGFFGQPSAPAGAGFTFSAPNTAPNTAALGGFFNNNATQSPSAPFGQPTPASPFPSQPNSPFASPAQGFKTLNSNAPIPPPIFGSSNPTPSFANAPSQGGTGFTFSAAAPGVTSPTHGNATATTPSAPTFVFGTGSQPSSPTINPHGTPNRPLARLPRRAGSTARRGPSGTR